MRKASPAPGLTTAAVRAIQALGAAPAGRADQIADRLAEAIRLGLIAPGERLPAEAALSEQLGVATLTLREALATLRDRGLVVTRRGRAGGSFVARAEDAEPGPIGGGLGELTARRLSELGDLRHAVLGTAAALAARRATAPEVEALRRRVDRLAAAASPRERRLADGEFGIELAAAAQSPRLTQAEANLRAESGDLVWARLGEAEHAAAVRGRRALVDAVAAGKPELARELAQEQIAAETELLIRRHATEVVVPLPERAEQIWTALADEIECIFEYLRATSDEFTASFAASGVGDASGNEAGDEAPRYTLADLALLRPRIHATLAAFRDLAVGTGIVVAPGVLDGAAYWLEWWWQRQGTAAPESLRVNLDPAGPDFFDYVNSEWYSVPIGSGAHHVAGPYVDYACTNQYTFTLSVPVFSAHGRPLGVAAMDIPCDRLERRILSALRAEPAPRALRNAHGRVIAALPATAASADAVANAGPTASAALARLCDLTGWTAGAAVTC